MDASIIFSSLDIAKSIAEYFELIDSANAKIDRLAKSELDAGLRALRQSQNSIGQRESLLKDSRSHFNKAISLEKNSRKTIAILGNSICHYHLKDYTNSRDILEEILKQDPIDFETELKDTLKNEWHRLLPGFKLRSTYKTIRKMIDKNYRFEQILIVINRNGNSKFIYDTQKWVSKYLEKEIKWEEKYK
jgi:tetratricopeptide (TPR) repeat protein